MRKPSLQSPLSHFLIFITQFNYSPYLLPPLLLFLLKNVLLIRSILFLLTIIIIVFLLLFLLLPINHYLDAVHFPISSLPHPLYTPLPVLGFSSTSSFWSSSLSTHTHGRLVCPSHIYSPIGIRPISNSSAFFCLAFHYNY